MMKLSIIVKPGSSKGPLVEIQPDDSLIIFIREITSDGQANNALIKILSKHYNIPKTKIEISRGHTSRHKVVSII